jgi:hypothetical protein
VAPAAAWNVHTSKYLLGHSASSARFLDEIPMFATYYVYTRFLTWSPDGLHLYYQVVFTRKGRSGSQQRNEKVFKGIPSIIPDDEIVCAILYVRNQMIRHDGKKLTMEEIFKEEGYDPYHPTVRRIKEKGWEYVKNLHVAWDKGLALAGIRQMGHRL